MFKVVLDQRHFVDEPSILIYKKDDKSYALDAYSKKIVSSSTDDSTVFQDAIDAVGTGELVAVRSGKYHFNAVVDVKDRALHARGRAEITGRGFKVDGGGSIVGFKLVNTVGTAIDVAGGGVTVAFNIIEYPSEDGIRVNGDVGAENFYVGNIIQSAGRYGINFERTGTSDVGGHYFRENLIGNLSETMRSKAGVRLYGPQHSASYIWWLGNVIDAIKDGPAILIEGVTPVNICGWNWITTAKNNTPIIDVKNCDRLILKDATLAGPSGCVGVMFRGVNDTAFIDGVFTRGISRLFALDTGAVVYNKAVGPMLFIDVPNPSDINAYLYLDGVRVFTSAGATPAGYLEVRIGTSSYRIPLHPLA